MGLSGRNFDELHFTLRYRVRERGEIGQICLSLYKRERKREGERERQKERGENAGQSKRHDNKEGERNP